MYLICLSERISITIQKDGNEHPSSITIEKGQAFSIPYWYVYTAENSVEPAREATAVERVYIFAGKLPCRYITGILYDVLWSDESGMFAVRSDYESKNIF